MAVTIITNPNEYTPSDNPIVWTFSSDETAQPNFRFIVEVYVDGALDSSHEVYPEVGNRGHFDASPIAKRVCAFMRPALNVIVQENKNWQPIRIKIIEYYGSPLAFHDAERSLPVYAYKARLSNEEFDLYRTQSNQYIQGGVSRRFNTFLNRTFDVEMRVNDSYLVGIINDNDTLTAIKVVLYDATNNIIATARVTTVVDTEATRINIYNLSPALWIMNTPLTSANYNNAARFEYFVERTDNNTRVSEIRSVTFNRECGYFGRQLSWVNKFGSFDNFLFFHNQQAETEISEQSYEKQYGGWVGNDYVLNASEAGTRDYIKNMKDKVRITSDWMEMPIFNWLTRSLLESPYVLAQFEGQTHYLVLPRNTTYAEAQDRFEELFSLTVECDLPNERQSQLL